MPGIQASLRQQPPCLVPSQSQAPPPPQGGCWWSAALLLHRDCPLPLSPSLDPQRLAAPAAFRSQDQQDTISQCQQKNQAGRARPVPQPFSALPPDPARALRGHRWRRALPTTFCLREISLPATPAFACAQSALCHSAAALPTQARGSQHLPPPKSAGGSGPGSPISCAPATAAPPCLPH